jgi:hypothetical protein
MTQLLSNSHSLIAFPTNQCSELCWVEQNDDRSANHIMIITIMITITIITTIKFEELGANIKASVLAGLIAFKLNKSTAITWIDRRDGGTVCARLNGCISVDHKQYIDIDIDIDGPGYSSSSKSSIANCGRTPPAPEWSSSSSSSYEINPPSG